MVEKEESTGLYKVSFVDTADKEIVFKVSYQDALSLGSLLIGIADAEINWENLRDNSIMLFGDED